MTIREESSETSETSVVFIVDGDDAANKALQSVLAPMGATVVRFLSAEDFLQYYDGSQSGCLVTELRLPGMGGLDLQRALRDGGNILPTIVFTDCADVPAAVESMRLGARTVLEKPCRNLVLWNEIRRGLDIESRFQRARRKRSASPRE